MVAIDTNIVIRFLTRDDATPADRARRLVESEPVWVSTTVLLESEWVLRRLSGLPRHMVLQLLQAFAGLENVSIQDPVALVEALRLANAGMDFADALHVSATPTGEKFATFDLDFVRVAHRMGRVEVYSL